MNKNGLLFALLVIISLIFGCATIPHTPLQTRGTSAVMLAPKDKVWPLIVSEVSINYPIQAIEKESGLLTTQSIKILQGFQWTAAYERYVFLPERFFVRWDGLRMDMRIMVIETEPGKTIVTIKARYEVFDRDLSMWIEARSKGFVENQILNNIEVRLR
jgi:hypothetical protein